MERLFPGPIADFGDAAERPMAPARGIGEKIARNFEAARRLDNLDGSSILYREEMQRRLDGIEAKTGRRLPNPYRDQFDEVDEGQLYRQYRMPGMGPGSDLKARDAIQQARLRALEDQIDQLAKSYPDIETRDRFRQSVSQRARDLGAQTEGTGLPGFLGDVGAAFTDPIQLATMPLGGGSRTILGAAVKEAAINTAVETGLQPLVQANRAELGVDASWSAAGQNILAATVFGGLFGGGVKAGEKAYGRLTRRELIDATDALPEDLKTPDVMAARNDLAKELMTDEAAGLDGVDPVRDAIHEEALASVAVNDLSSDSPGAAAPLPKDRRASSPLDIFDPLALQVDAKRFQFKSGGDAEGVTDALKDVKVFDPMKAGDILVWEDRNGVQYVADGHQRTGLARRLAAEGQQVQLHGFTLRETDGISAEDARAIAAAKNLAQGTGTAVDAAKVLRVNPELLDGTLSPRTAVFRNAMGLKELGDDAFGMVINGVVREDFAGLVGRLVREHGEQTAILDILARQNPATLTEAEALVREALASGFSREVQVGLFGTDVVTESLMADRAAVLAGAVSRLRREKGIFRTLTEEADNIEAAGNRLNTQVNQELAQNAAEIADIVLRTAHVTGPVSDALRAAVEHVQRGGHRSKAIRDFIDALRDIGPEGLRGLDRVGNGAGRGGADPQPAGAGGRSEASPAGLAPKGPDLFDDPRKGVEVQVESVRADVLDTEEPGQLLTGLQSDDDGNVSVRMQSAEDLQAEIEYEDGLFERLEGCIKR